MSARTAAQLDENLGGAALQLDAAHHRRLTDASTFEVGYPYQFLASIQGRW